MEEFIKNKEELINEQISAAMDIKDEHGVEKAIGYLIGEKFYDLIKEFRFWQKSYKNRVKTINDFKILLTKFSEKIRDLFTEEEINGYFESNPRFGCLGHTATEEEHKLFVEKGAVEHTINTEIEDALIMGEMKKYFEFKG